MKVDIENVFEIKEKLKMINKAKLEDLEFYLNGERQEVSKEDIEKWDFICLNNVDFIMCYDWRKKND